MERRGVLKSFVAGAAALAASAIPYGLLHLLAPGRAAAERNDLRPPGALKDEAAFGGANRPAGCVAMLARWPVAPWGHRAYPGGPICPMRWVNISDHWC